MMEQAAPKQKPDSDRIEEAGEASAEAAATLHGKGAEVHVDFTNDELPDQKLRDLHAIWLAKSGSGRLPGRDDFDPTELPPHLLPWITIFDVEGSRLHIRIVGTGIVEALGMDTTGHYLDELPNVEDLHARARWAVENGKPFYVTDLAMAWDEDRWGHYSVLCLPLASDGSQVDKLLYLMSFS
jgi:hypothetical protein